MPHSKINSLTPSLETTTSTSPKNMFRAKVFSQEAKARSTNGVGHL